MSRHIPDAIAAFLGYSPTAKLEETQRMLAASKRTTASAIQEASGYRAQRDLLQKFYDRANRRLEAAGLMSVTTFF